MKRIFPNFEPQSWQDIALIPWWLGRYLFAWCWSLVWYPWIKLCIFWRWQVRPLVGLERVTTYAGGRHIDPDPVICPVCLWAGPYRWLYHTYSACREDDVEPVSECPRCGWEL